MSAVLEVNQLRKGFRTPLRRQKVEILRGVTFAVERGEVFGFLGPNGAGKTTTIRILMGLVAADGGAASMFGEPVPSRAARQRLGFLPESPYFYDYLYIDEMLDLTGRLFGLDRKTRKRRSEALIERVGLGHARKTALKKFSKGMLQRAGIAQALINDPELVVLDEPTSGLDPVGRREVREIIESLRDQGKTVFFSSHILADVEAVSDRIGVIVGGRIRDLGSIGELVAGELRATSVTLRRPDGSAPGGPGADDADGGAVISDSGTSTPGDDDEVGGDAALAALVERVGQGAHVARSAGSLVTLTLPTAADVDAALAEAHAAGYRVHAVTPHHESLEDLFMRHVRPEAAQADDDGAADDDSAADANDADGADDADDREAQG